jgi:hypothetical protein
MTHLSESGPLQDGRDWKQMRHPEERYDEGSQAPQKQVPRSRSG